MIPKLNRTLLAIPLSCCVLLAAPSYADTVVLNAIDDFALVDGDASFYADTAYGALAIDASVVENRDVFARAETTFADASGQYNIKIMGLAELDGESEYQLLLNGKVIGKATNPSVLIDYTPIAHRVLGVGLVPGDILAVQAKAASNDLIPEGDGFAFARGRWTELRLTPVQEIDFQGDKVALSGHLSAKSTTIEADKTVTIEYAVINENEGGAVATGVGVLVEVPDSFGLPPLGNCTQTDNPTGNKILLSCPLQEVPPGQSANGQIAFIPQEINDSISIFATAFANETDADGSDNRAALAVSVVAELPTIDEPEPDTQADAADATSQVGLLSVGSSIALFLMLVVRRRQR